MTARIAIILGSLILLFLLIGILIFLEPEWVVARLRKRSPSVLYSIDTLEPVVALTVDDGPDPVQTHKILDILGQYDAHATFFLISSRIPGNEEIVQRMLEEGHEIANHLVYDEPSIRLAPDEFERQLLEADQVLSQFGETIWLRPGSGWYNNGMLDIIRENGYQCALGSVYPFDPQIGSTWFIKNYVLWKVNPGEVIVLHDYGARGRRTAEALATILPELQERGYSVVTLSDLDEVGTGGD
jgi:peptidoglycan/xylan/chitin deacetylase (PgdA/CDA1 family)